jgi:hypothetical protein
MANTIQITVEVDDKGIGTIKNIENAVKSVGKSVDEMSRKSQEAAKKTQDAYSKIGANIKNEFIGLGKQVAALFAAEQIVAFGKSIIDLGDRLNKMSQITGATVNELDKLRKIAELSDTDFDGLTTVFANMTRTIADAQQVSSDAAIWLNKLGTSFEELKTKTPTEQLQILAKAITAIENPTERSAAMLAVFKRGAVEIQPFLKGVALDFDKITSVWDNEKAQRMEDFNDSITELKQTFQDLAATILTDVFRAFNYFFSASGEFARKGKQFIELNKELGDRYGRRAEMDSKGGRKAFAHLYDENERTIQKLEERLAEMKPELEKLEAGAKAQEERERRKREPKPAPPPANIPESAADGKARLALEAQIAKEILIIRNNLYEAELVELEKNYNEYSKITKDKVKLEEWRLLQLGRIQGNELTRLKALQSAYDEFYESKGEVVGQFTGTSGKVSNLYDGTGPSEKRFLQNKTYQEAPLFEEDKYIGTAKDIDELLKKEREAIQLQNEYSRAWASVTQKDRNDVWDKEIEKIDEEINQLKELNELTEEQQDKLEELEINKQRYIRQKGASQKDVDLQADLRSLDEWYDQMKHVYGESEKLQETFLLKQQAIYNKYKSGLEKWTETAQSFADQLDNIVIEMAESISSNLSDSFLEFIDGTKSAEQAFREFASTFLREMAKMILQQTILNSLKEAMNSGTSTGSGLQGFLGWVAQGIGGSGGTTGNSYSTGMTTNSFAGGFSGRAEGGPVKAGEVYVVGEKGPELFHPGMNGSITPNNSMRAYSKSQGISINNNITINGNGNQSVAEQRQQARMLSDMLDAKITDNLMKYERSRGRGGI